MDDSDYLINDAVRMYEANDKDKALQLLEKARKKYPNNANIENTLAIFFLKEDEKIRGIEHLKLCINQDPLFYSSYLLLGELLLEQGILEEAIYYTNKFTEISPEPEKGYFLRGKINQALEYHQKAVEDFEIVIAFEPRNTMAYFLHAVNLSKGGDDDMACLSYKKVLSMEPSHAEAHCNLGVIKEKNNKIEQAIEHYNEALSYRPNFPEALDNRGLAFQRLNLFKEAIDDHLEAIQQSPELKEAHVNLGNAYRSVYKFQEAIQSFLSAIAIDSNFAPAYWNKSLAFLAIGELERGFKLYEWRWERGDLKKIKRKLDKPLWLGDFDIQGKTILIYYEQGLGDSIQFSRYINFFKNMNVQVFFEVQPQLQKLFERTFDVKIISTKDSCFSFDIHCPIMSLPLCFKTSLNTIPCKDKYLFADEKKVLFWKNYLKKNTNTKVGIVWSGNSVHPKDFSRSIKLENFLTGLPRGRHHFFSLQKDVRYEDQKTLSQLDDVKNFGMHLEDFTDTAAIASNMDLVVTVDTSIAHLCGALGIKTWILLSHDSDWRWLINRTDSPWYSSVRLFRQAENGDWNNVLLQLKTELSKFFDESI
mgnify:CR=1 FL=1